MLNSVMCVVHIVMLLWRGARTHELYAAALVDVGHMLHNQPSSYHYCTDIVNSFQLLYTLFGYTPSPGKCIVTHTHSKTA